MSQSNCNHQYKSVYEDHDYMGKCCKYSKKTDFITRSPSSSTSSSFRSDEELDGLSILRKVCLMSTIKQFDQRSSSSFDEVHDEYDEMLFNQRQQTKQEQTNNKNDDEPSKLIIDDDSEAITFVQYLNGGSRKKCVKIAPIGVASSVDPKVDDKTKKSMMPIDELRAMNMIRDLWIPHKHYDLVHMSIENFNAVITNYCKNEKQENLLRDIRRRGKQL